MNEFVFLKYMMIRYWISYSNSFDLKETSFTLSVI
jgi:hypothetical protein